MHAFRRLATFIFFGIITARCAETAVSQVFAPDASVAGKPLTEWVPDLWQLQFTNDLAVAIDPTFDYFNTNNDGPVFLSITPDGPLSPDSPSEIVVTRSVPADRPVIARVTAFAGLFLPEEVDAAGVPVWFSQNPIDGVRLPDLDWARQFAAQNLESLSGLAFEVTDSSGSVLVTSGTTSDYRVAIVVPFLVPVDNPFGIPGGEWPLVTDGYYAMLEPITRGEQATLARTFSAPWGTDFRITTHFRAVPEPTSAALAAVLVGVAFIGRRRRRKVRQRDIDNRVADRHDGVSFTSFAFSAAEPRDQLQRLHNLGGNLCRHRRRSPTD